MSRRDLTIVLVISLGSFMAGLDATIVNIALPSIARYFNVSTVTVSWVLNAYLIVMVSLLLAASRLGDMKGYRNIFLIGFFLFTLGSMFCGIAPNIGALILARMLQGMGGAVISALGAVMITTYLSPAVRGQALGIMSMFLMLGVAFGPVVGGFLTSTFSWRFIFYVNLPVGIAATLLGMKVLPELRPSIPQTTMDLPGVLLLFIALGCLVTGLTSAQGNRIFLGFVLIAISLVFWFFFFLRERWTSSPLINLSLFYNRDFTLQNIGILLVQMAMAGVMIMMPFYLELIRNIPTDHAGVILLTMPVGMILSAPIAGRLSDVIGTKKPIIAGFLICAAATLLLSNLSAQTGTGFVALYLLLFGCGTGVAFTPLASAVMGEAPVSERASSSGLMRVMANIGSTLGVAVVMLVGMIAAGPKLAEVTASRIPSTELTGAFDTAFFFCMLLEIVGILLMLPVREREPSGDEKADTMLGI